MERYKYMLNERCWAFSCERISCAIASSASSGISSDIIWAGEGEMELLGHSLRWGMAKEAGADWCHRGADRDGLVHTWEQASIVQ